MKHHSLGFLLCDTRKVMNNHAWIGLSSIVCEKVTQKLHDQSEQTSFKREINTKMHTMRPSGNVSIIAIGHEVEVAISEGVNVQVKCMQ